MAELCIRCGGSKMYMGNGMIMSPCTLCASGNKDKKEVEIVAPTLDKVDRRSKSYKDTINDIMKTSNVSRDEATIIFDQTYENV